MPDFNTYLSPFTWRYGTPDARRIWSERYKRLIWRQIWVALAETQAEFGLVSPEQVTDLFQHSQDIDIAQAHAIEAEIHHDLMAELRVFATQCPLGGKILHLGATSMDIEDNADVLRMRESLDLLVDNLASILKLLCSQIKKYADTPLIAFTHLQPAEPSTLGYRLALYGQDLLEDYRSIVRHRLNIRGKGFSGAVGTRASYADLVGIKNLAAFEQKLSEKIGLKFFPVTSQVYPRKQDFEILSALAGLGASLYKFAFDLRLLQSPPIGELSESFEEKQVGSSAMPFKRNPIQAEKLNSLGRYLAGLPRMAWDNAAHSLLERTLDDSANRRILLPEAFLVVDEMLNTALNVFKGLHVDQTAMERNLETYAPFAATERLMIALVKAGADRQMVHEHIRVHTLQAWKVIQDGESNPLTDLLASDNEIRNYLPKSDILAALTTGSHVGDAPQRARALAKEIEQSIVQKNQKH